MFFPFQFTLQVPEKNLNYRTQLMHSRLLQHGSESSTHLKINYNNLMPLVAGLHWKSPPENSLHKKWEGVTLSCVCGCGEQLSTCIRPADHHLCVSIQARSTWTHLDSTSMPPTG